MYRVLARLYYDGTLRGKADVVRKRAEQQLKRVNEPYECRESAAKLRDTGFEVCPACGKFRNGLDVRFCGGCGEDLKEF